MTALEMARRLIHLVQTHGNREVRYWNDGDFHGLGDLDTAEFEITDLTAEPNAFWIEGWKADEDLLE